MKHGCYVGWLLLCAAVASAKTVPFERYQVILDHAPFGQPTVAAAAESAPVAATLKNLRLSALLCLPDGAQAGFVDSQGKNGFMLRLHEKSDSNVELLAVDYEREQVTVKMDDQELVLGLQPGSEALRVAAASTMKLNAGLPAESTFRPGPPPLPPHFTPEMRAIFGPPAQAPDPQSPEGRHWRKQQQALLNPQPPSEADKLALPTPNGTGASPAELSELLAPVER